MRIRYVIKKSFLSQVKDIASIIWNNDIGFVYEEHTHDNDYIILKLGSPLQFNKNVQPACLPSSSTFLGLDSTKTTCFTSGWGKLDFSKLFLVIVSLYTKNRNGILATKTVWHEILLRHIIFAYHWTSKKSSGMQKLYV